MTRSSTLNVQNVDHSEVKLFGKMGVQSSNTNQEYGVIGLIHPESHFAELKAEPLRRRAYLRLRRHFHFWNALKLFEVHDQVNYGVHVYATEQSEPHFTNVSNLYHPQTALNSFNHEGCGVEPGFKTNSGDWDLRPHAARIQRVDEETLYVWSTILGSDDAPSSPRMVYTVSEAPSSILSQLAKLPRMETLNLGFSRGWDESIDRKKGIFETKWSRPNRWEDVILQGPHLGILTPFIKEPNPTLKHNQDWSTVSYENLTSSTVPATAFIRTVEPEQYREAYGAAMHGAPADLVIDNYRLAWRTMAAKTGYRTLYPCIIPPGSAHVDGIFSTYVKGGDWARSLLLIAGVSSSLFVDFFLRSFVNSAIRAPHFMQLPLGTPSDRLDNEIVRTVARLNCVTEAWAPLWEAAFNEPWGREEIIFETSQRRGAQAKIDRLVSEKLGMTEDDFTLIYNTQFPVLRSYDQGVFDRVAAGWR